MESTARKSCSVFEDKLTEIALEDEPHIAGAKRTRENFTN